MAIQEWDRRHPKGYLVHDTTRVIYAEEAEGGLMEIYWGALAIHLLVTLYLVWRVDTFYKIVGMQVGLNQSLTDFATATVEEVEELQDDIIDLQEDLIDMQNQVDEITKTPATS
jgi:hypothetical protein